MERKTGEIFEFDGDWYQCIECDSCDYCSLRTTECGSGTKSDLADEVFGLCSKVRRTDNKRVVFKKLEKVGELFNFEDALIQELKIIDSRYICDSCFFKNRCTSNSLGLRCRTNTSLFVLNKQNKEDIEEYKMHDAKEDIPEFDKIVDECLFDKQELNKKDMEEKKVKLDKLVTDYTSNKITYNEFEKAIKELYADKEEKKLEPFNLEQAKQGKPVCTMDGRKARIICFDRKNNDNNYNIVALVENKDSLNKESIRSYYNNGKYLSGDEESVLDLMMLPEKKEGWVNVYNADTTFYYVEGIVYNTKDEAIQKAKEEITTEQREKIKHVDTVKICWEE